MAQISIPENCAEIVNQVASQINIKSIWLGVLITSGVILISGLLLVFYLHKKGVIDVSIEEDGVNKEDEQEEGK